MVEGVRNFKLINRHGREWDLMDVPKSFLINPSGLGWAQEGKFDRLGYTYFTTEENEKRSTVSGTIVFDGYQTYADFLSFVQVGGLVFGYRPLTTWYFVNCLIELDKSEISYDTGVLECPVTFQCRSYWYKKTIARTTSADTTDAKKYDYEYPYTYETEAANVFDFNCSLPSYFKLTVFGECVNPSWSLYVDGEEVYDGAVTYTIQTGQKLVVNSNPNRAEISLYTTADEYAGNLHKYSDKSKVRLFALPQGRSRLIVTSDDATPPQVVVEVWDHV